MSEDFKKQETIEETKEETKTESKKKKTEVSETKTEVVETKPVVQESCSGYVVSRLNHPVMIHYDRDALMLPPRGKMYFENLNLVNNLPKEGCYMLKNK